MKTLLALLGLEAGAILASLLIGTQDELVGLSITVVLMVLAAAMMLWVTRKR